MARYGVAAYCCQLVVTTMALWKGRWEGAAARAWVAYCCPLAVTYSQTRCRKLTTRRLTSSASIGGIVIGGSTRFGANTTAIDLIVIRLTGSCLAMSYISHSNHVSVAR